MRRQKGAEKPKHQGIPMSTAEHIATPIDARELRQVLSTFVTGVTVVTTIDKEGRRHGVTANSFNSVSLDPPLVLWSQALRAFSHPAFRDAEHFAVNILAQDQISISERFARAGADKFAGVEVREGLGDAPLIQGCTAYLQCSRHASHLAGDHMIFIGRVESIERSGRRPLAFGSGRYLIAEAHDFGRISQEEATANRSRLQAVRLATHSAIELASRLDETIGVAVWGTHGPTILHWEPSSRPVSLNLRVGAVLPVASSATGRALAAWLPKEVSAPLVTAEALASGSSVDAALASFDAAIDSVRRMGEAKMDSVSNFQDRTEVAVASASVPVFDREGQVLLALTVLGEGGRINLSSQSPILSSLKATAADLSQRMQGIPAAKP